MTKVLWAISLVFSSVIRASACDCSAPSTQELFNNSDRVFYGKVTDVKFLEPNEPGKEPKIEVIFKVLKEWKGDSRVTKLKTTYNKWSCAGFLGRKNDKVLIFSRCKDGVCGTELCEHFGSPEHIKTRSSELDDLVQ